MENTYENTVVENFPATRQVVVGYRWVYFGEVLSSLSTRDLIRTAERLGWKPGLPDDWRKFFDVSEGFPSHYFYHKDGFTTDEYCIMFEEGYWRGWGWDRRWHVVDTRVQRVHPAFYYWCRTGGTYGIPLNYFELGTCPISTHVKIIRK